MRENEARDDARDRPPRSSLADIMQLRGDVSEVQRDITPPSLRERTSVRCAFAKDGFEASRPVETSPHRRPASARIVGALLPQPLGHAQEGDALRHRWDAQIPKHCTPAKI